MRKVLALQVGTVASGVLLAMTLATPAVQAACNDYGQPPCPVPTVTPAPPSPGPAPTPTPTPTATPIPIPTFTPEPVETTNPQQAEVLGGGSIIVLSQEAAESAPPRLVLQPLGFTTETGQVVLMTRLEAEQIIVQFLQPRVRYLSQIFADGRWSTLGNTTANAKGQLVLPAIRGMRLGLYPLRTIPGSASANGRKVTRFFTIDIVRDKELASASAQPNR
ncbi:MAG: hypothetical protein Q8L05_07870 [Actinomycetota bacterium]|nr:hypothetical protein [Actinomycetota bacterium]MDP2289312.1 hypothetical protein [Actinomycetota bacterium]